MKLALRILAVVVLSVVLLGPLARATPAPTVSGYVAPSTGTVNDQFVFVMKYTGKFNLTSAILHVNDDTYAMVEVDSSDHNASNGKDYEYKTHLPSGANIFYFEALDTNGTVIKSNVAAISVEPWFNFSHTDVAIVMAVFMIPVVIIMFMLRRTLKAMEKIAEGKVRADEQRASESLNAAVAKELSKESGSGPEKKD